MNKFLLLLSMLSSSADLYAWVDTTLQSMSLEEKIAQLLMPGVRLNCPASIKEARQLVARYHVGGLLFVNLGNNFIQDVSVTEHLSPQEQAQLAQDFQSLSKYSLLIAQDLEWGLAMRMKNALRFPHAMTLAAMRDEALIYDIAKEIGRQARLSGVHINFAPVVDVNNNPANPVIHDRSFGDDKEAVVRKALLFMQGLHASDIISCAKHFPGHGDTDVDSHYELPCLSHTKKRLQELELYPFKRLIDAGVPMIMSAHLHIPSLDAEKNVFATLSSAVITELLKKELGFRGVVVTDSLRMQGVTKYFTSAQAAVQAFLAGNDLLLDPENPLEALSGIYDAVKKCVIQEQDIDVRVKKILSLKYALGLHIKKALIQNENTDYITPHAEKLKREAYRQAITLVRDEKKLLPLNVHKTYAYIEPTIHREFTTLLSQYISFNHYQSFVEPSMIHEQVVILPLFELTRKKEDNFGLSLHINNLINELLELGKQLLVIAFGTPYILEIISPDVTVIIAYEDDADVQQAAAEVLGGRFIPLGILPILRSYQKSQPFFGNFPN